MWFQDRPASSRLELAGDMLLKWMDRLCEFTLGTATWLFWVCLGLAVIGVVRCIAEKRRRLVALLAWTGLHLVVYLVALPTFGHGGRYQPLVAALFLPLAWLGLDDVLSAALARAGPAVRPPFKKAVHVLAACAPAVFVIPCLDVWSRAQLAAVDHVTRTEVRMGSLLRSLPENAKVASFDIGGIGYFSRRSIVDLGGLTSPEAIPRIRRGEIWSYLDELAVDYVVVPVGYNLGFPDPWNFYLRLGFDLDPRRRLELVAETSSAKPLWVEGLRATLHCAPRQQLYRLAERIP
jgi:hypothetical protein